MIPTVCENSEERYVAANTLQNTLQDSLQDTLQDSMQDTLHACAEEVESVRVGFPQSSQDLPDRNGTFEQHLSDLNSRYMDVADVGSLSVAPSYSKRWCSRRSQASQLGNEYMSMAAELMTLGTASALSQATECLQRALSISPPYSEVAAMAQSSLAICCILKRNMEGAKRHLARGSR